MFGKEEEHALVWLYSLALVEMDEMATHGDCSE